MTTSILSVHAGSLTGFDIQVLKDFALSAPYEWRRVFESLIALAEATEGLELKEIQDVVAQKEQLAEKVKILEESVESSDAKLAKTEERLEGLVEAGEQLLADVKALQADVVGATTSQWQAKMNFALTEFSDEMAE